MLCTLIQTCCAVQTCSDLLCCADLFTGNGGQIAVGVVLVILLPLGFLLASAFFIWRYLYHPRAHQRRAAFILLENPDEPMVCCLLLSLLLLLLLVLLLLLPVVKCLYQVNMSRQAMPFTLAGAAFCPDWGCLSLLSRLPFMLIGLAFHASWG